MTELIKITDVEPLGDYWLRLSFTDGSIKDIDLEAVLAQGGVFAAIHDDRDLFEQVRVNPDTRTVEWPGDIDLDAEVLYGHHEPSSGVKINRRIVRSPAPLHA
jgi:Protein of unknown function (DUF2442)